MGVEQYINPKFAITLNGNRNHKLIITSLSYIDYESDNADTLSLNLSYNSPLPKFSDRIELFLGRDSLNFMGAFYVSSIKEEYKQSYLIEATSIDFSKELKIKKNRSFEKLSYGDILKTIARENNLKTKLNFKYKDSIEQIEQVDESDSSLIDRLSKELDCSFAIKNDTLIFLDRDLAFERRAYSINADDCISLSIEEFSSKHYNSLELTYTDTEGNTRMIKVGKGVPIYKMSANVDNDSSALQRANARLQSLNAKKFKGSLNAIGRVLFAGGFLHLNKQGKISTHIITQVTHTLDSKSWNMSLEFESGR